MRIAVYEFLTATRRGCDPQSPEHALYREGRAMHDALMADFGRIPGCCVSSLSDLHNLPEDTDLVVIAPETGGLLAELVRCRPSPLNATVEAIELTTDKARLAEHWQHHGIPTPTTTQRPPRADDSFPMVWKPRDGAGSTDTFLIRDPAGLATAMAQCPSHHDMIVQPFIPGCAASVAFLCGPRQTVPLIPTFQHLAVDDRLHYTGGELPLPEALAERAVRLAQRAIACVPGLRGYVGVDVVLGEPTDGSGDYAIEINPRLTTSYIGLRVAAAFNIAELWWRIARGEPVAADAAHWQPGRVRWNTAGTIARA
ncbi:MAG: ATP-grasp domain-containing protein [Gemmataceae bacterium]|nr:ATP-grasp domain-containing protein [Gemmata sp.]MDW8199501.1 ATP-grasp domain-containing protein [Gemmataceae bacterium]